MPEISASSAATGAGWVTCQLAPCFFDRGLLARRRLDRDLIDLVRLHVGEDLLLLLAVAGLVLRVVVEIAAERRRDDQQHQERAQPSHLAPPPPGLDAREQHQARHDEDRQCERCSALLARSA